MRQPERNEGFASCNVELGDSRANLGGFRVGLGFNRLGGTASQVDSSCDRLGRRPGWDCAELLQQSKLVDYSPVFACPPVIAKARDVDQTHVG